METLTQDYYQKCIDTCYSCAETCDVCASSCLGEQDVKMLARCIRLDNDCAMICRAAATYMARGSEFARQVCSLCADICNACADECEKHKHMEHCKKCAAACRTCAGECERIARGAHV
jgi:hypothetical protein